MMGRPVRRPPDRWDSCEKKQGHTWDEAKALAARARIKSGDHRIEAYHCPHCFKAHIGKTNRAI